jgi:hypothetical protein
MRPTTGDGKLTMFAEARDGKLRAVVTALDKDDQFMNFLALRGAAVGPDMKPLDLNFEQFAPGRYVAECPLQESGNYFVTVVPGQGLAPLRTGVNVPHSAEFRDKATNLTLLANLAGQKPEHGKPGRVIPQANIKDDPLREGDVFRRDLPPALARRPFWHYTVLIAACVFLCDVFFRRVAVSFAPVGVLAARLGNLLRRRDAVAATPEQSLERLRGQKEAIARQLDDRRAAVRFEAPPAEGAVAPLEMDAEPADAIAPKSEPQKSSLAPAETDADAETYTERLLKAKRGMRK